MSNMIKFLILDADPAPEPEDEAREGTAPVTLRFQREGALEPDPTIVNFTNRSQLERTFEVAGLGPCLLNPADMDDFWSVTDEQLATLSHPVTS
jgi:hypothetical protein